MDISELINEVPRYCQEARGRQPKPRRVLNLSNEEMALVLRGLESIGASELLERLS